jgi:type IV pilus assembly protein PilV
MKNIRSLSILKGLSLIEVLVTITITSIGLMGLVSLQMQAVRATTDSGNHSQRLHK